MKFYKYLLLASVFLSVLLTACQKNENAALDDDTHTDPYETDSYVVTDLSNGETTLGYVYSPTNIVPEGADEWLNKIEEQKAKYGDMLPLEYEDWMPEGTYGIMTDMDGYMVSYATCGSTVVDGKRKTDIYIDYDGNRYVTIDSLDTEKAKAEIVFEDGTPASEDDLTPGTAMLVQYDTALESWPEVIYCTKIIILQ